MTCNKLHPTCRLDVTSESFFKCTLPFCKCAHILEQFHIFNGRQPEVTCNLPEAMIMSNLDVGQSLLTKKHLGLVVGISRISLDMNNPTWIHF